MSTGYILELNRMLDFQFYVAEIGPAPKSLEELIHLFVQVSLRQFAQSTGSTGLTKLIQYLKQVN